MTGSKSLKELLQGFITNLQLVEIGLDLSSTGSIVVSNFLVMVKLGKVNLQIHIKGVEGESLRGFFEGEFIGFIRAFPKNCQLAPIDA